MSSPFPLGSPAPAVGAVPPTGNVPVVSNFPDDIADDADVDREKGLGLAEEAKGDVHVQVKASRVWDGLMSSKSWSDLRLNPAIIRAMEEKVPRWDSPTAIQAQTLPYILNADPGKLLKFGLMGQAINGAGKTGAFTISSLSRVDPNKRVPQVIILEPTNQLVLQTAEEVASLSKYLVDSQNRPVEVVALQGRLTEKLTAQVVVGTEQAISTAIEGALIASPTEIHTMVIDEADDMITDPKGTKTVAIRERINPNAIVILFSASMNCLDPVRGDPKAQANVNDLLDLPENEQNVVQIRQPPQEMSKNVKHFLIPLAPDGPYDREAITFKIGYLSMLLPKLSANGVKTIVFVSSNQKVVEVTQRLMALLPGFPIAAVYKKKKNFTGLPNAEDPTQQLIKQRLREFGEGSIQVLVATGGLARGINIPGLEVVINFDIPTLPKLNHAADVPKFQHQCGRVGRLRQTDRGSGVCVHISVGKKEKLAIDDIARYLHVGNRGPNGEWSIPPLPGGEKSSSDEATDDAVEAILEALRNPEGYANASNFISANFAGFKKS